LRVNVLSHRVRCVVGVAVRHGTQHSSCCNASDVKTATWRAVPRPAVPRRARSGVKVPLGSVHTGRVDWRCTRAVNRRLYSPTNSFSVLAKLPRTRALPRFSCGESRARFNPIYIERTYAVTYTYIPTYQ